MEEEQSNSPSLRNKLKQTLCLSYCFPNNNNRRETLESDECSRLPEIRNKCRHLINRIARHNHRRRCSAAEFKYDPLSYALNFDEGGFNDDECLNEAALRNFSSRIPGTPPPQVKKAPKAGITCV